MVGELGPRPGSEVRPVLVGNHHSRIGVLQHPVSFGLPEVHVQEDGDDTGS
jgi:hypothetical protein